jgi:DNA polymerase-3 subunit delta
MAVLSEARIKEELQKKKLRAFYLFVGDDAFKQDHYANQVAAALFSDSKNAVKEILYGDELEPERLLDDARTLSLWDPQKMIMIRHGERVSAKQWEILLPLIQDPPEKCTILIQASKIDGRMKFFQSIAKAGESVVQVKLEPAIGGEWNIWLQTFLRESGKELAQDARDLLLEWNGGGSSLAELKHAIDRAALYSGEHKEIKREHIAAVGFKVSPEDVFRFSGGVLSGDRGEALSLLEGLLRQGEEPIALVGLLARQYRWLLGILSSRAEGKTDASISSEWGIFPGAAKVLLPASRRLGGKGVIQGLARLAEADALLKSSRLPSEHIVTRLVLQLTS